MPEDKVLKQWYCRTCRATVCGWRCYVCGVRPKAKPRPPQPKPKPRPQVGYDQTCGYPGEGPRGPNDRLRHHAQAKKAHKTREQRRGQGAWERIRSADAVGDVEPLLVHAVTDKTGLKSYLPWVKKCLDFAEEHNLDFGDWEQRDFAIAKFLCHKAYVDDDVGPQAGDYVLNGMAYVWPESRNNLPRAWRALQGWHRIHIHGEGAPEALELLAVMEETMKERGQLEESEALAVIADCWLRCSEAFALRSEDIVLMKERSGPEAGVQQAVLRIGVAERGEAAKTGMRQGVRVDTPHAVDILSRRKEERGPKDNIFKSNSAQFRKIWNATADLLKHKIGPPHSIRHSGPANDVGTNYRTLWQAQRRGRWASEKSVLRYSKTHTWVEQRAKTDPNLMDKGRAILDKRAPRPEAARE